MRAKAAALTKETEGGEEETEEEAEETEGFRVLAEELLDTGGSGSLDLVPDVPAGAELVTESGRFRK